MVARDARCYLGELLGEIDAAFEEVDRVARTKLTIAALEARSSSPELIAPSPALRRADKQLCERCSDLVE